MSNRVPTGHRIAAVARRLGIHPIAPDGNPPGGSYAAVAENGDVFDLADVFEHLLERIEKLERRASSGGSAPTDLQRFG